MKQIVVAALAAFLAFPAFVSAQMQSEEAVNGMGTSDSETSMGTLDFEAADTDSSGSVSQDEADLAGISTDDFDTADEDGDGELTADEYETASGGSSSMGGSGSME